MVNEIRKPAVASLFYPEDKINLKRMINTFLSQVPREISEYFKKKNIDRPFGIISPHAGYFYSGQVAAYGYSLLKGKSVDTVILIGPSHYMAFKGFALSQFKAYNTPLGDIEIDSEISKALVTVAPDTFNFMDSVGLKEHCLEVQLPFLQATLTNGFKIVPIITGEHSSDVLKKGAAAISEVIKNTDKSVLIVVSTDLSHYYSSEEAKILDKNFIETLEHLDADKLINSLDSGKSEACGGYAVCTFLEIAKLLGHTNIKTLKYDHSGTASNDNSRVVGYLSASIW